MPDIPHSFTAQDSLIAVMVAISASDENIRTSELITIEAIVNHLPVFAAYDTDRIKNVSQTVFDLHGVDWTPSAFSDLSLNASCPTPTDFQFQQQHSSTPTRAIQQDKWKDRPLRVLNVNF